MVTSKPKNNAFSISGPFVFSKDSKFNGHNEKKKTTESAPAEGIIPKHQTVNRKKPSTFGIKKREA